jgi:hypothetical protein
MSAHSITPKQFHQVKKLLRIGHSEMHRMAFTVRLLSTLLPPVTGLERLLAQSFRDNVSARELCRQLQVRVTPKHARRAK